MSTISSATSGFQAGAAAEASNATASRVPQKTLGQGDFLTLLATQFQAQDPLKPMEDTAFIAQMAQFSALEQSSAMAKELVSLRVDQQRTAANSYLGHQVTVDAGKGATITGAVTAVDASGAEPRLVVGDKSFALSAVLMVEPRVISAPAPAPAPVPADGAQS
ncbi:MAG: flagellar hook capping FlgD N-terminal domain-containing protein [Opitutaceae bacterium]|nr:flagellar hook capping FlgD N-terminal domain-containing protein [Opitutaceae bacterium]